jgi:LacI family transcriptional regulator
LSSVSSDNRLAAKQAIDALVSTGHHRIAVIGGEREISDTTRLRYQGCLEAFSSHNIDFDPALDYEEVRYSYEGGYQAACNLLDRGRSFTALFAMSDVMAIGVIRALHDRGIKVPEDVSVMGFDGVQVGEYIQPRLSTVRQDPQEMARRSVDILLENIKGTLSPRYETTPVRVLLRESTKNV